MQKVKHFLAEWDCGALALVGFLGTVLLVFAYYHPESALLGLVGLSGAYGLSR